MKWLVASVVIVFALLIPATASTDDGKNDNGFTLRVTGDLYIPPSQIVGAVVVVDGNVTVDGTVTDSLTVISGNAIVNGKVEKATTIISGTLDLRSGAQVDHINLIDSQLLRADGVTVTGAIEQSDGIEIPSGVLAALSIYFWLAMTLAVVVSGIVFAAIGGRQLNEAGRVAFGQPSNALIGSIAFWFIVPTLAVIAMLTVVGIPLGLGVLLFVLPAVWFLGTLTYLAYRAAGGKGFSPEGPSAPVATQTPSPAM